MNTTTWSDETITARIREIAMTTFGLELPDSARPIKDSGLDSLALIDIVMGLEESFGCQLPLERLPPNPTIDVFVALAQTSLASR
jgi:acyl carrier protein